ncbi:hypothetical protein T440DRAFT_471377 [Plenodomus tracheiphilus IPT5]|uniref:Ribosomal protein S21 n=1 Tax=Plenodomus tracheiphilus IPT5 TaxID=1408161 RepID=A0A6A7AXW9_9PLEO|nr:hypothetical protein T440DRAFT_471377 [Plenodomus tracheiphilus IPT5]
MASRSLGELLLRPSTFTRIQHSTCSQSLRQTSPSWTTHRSLSSTAPHSAQPQRKESDDFPFEQPQQQQQQQQQQPRPRRPSQSETTKTIDSLFSGMSSNRTAPPRFPSRGQPSSSDEVRAARTDHIFGSEFSSAARGGRLRRPPSLNFDSMALPDSVLDPSLSNKPTDAAALATQQEETFANYPRLDPTYGRTVDLDTSRGRDLVRGIGMLASLVARNKIRHEFSKQRFHERNGLKRKRLNSERWRARFKVGFTQITSRVTELTRKGW